MTDYFAIAVMVVSLIYAWLTHSKAARYKATCEYWYDQLQNRVDKLRTARSACSRLERERDALLKRLDEIHESSKPPKTKENENE